MIKFIKITLKHDGCCSNLTDGVEDSVITSLKLYSGQFTIKMYYATFLSKHEAKNIMHKANIMQQRKQK